MIRKIKFFFQNNIFFLILFSIIATNQAKVKNIIFDLNGVLFSNKTSFQIKKIGFFNLIRYTLQGQKNPLYLQKDFFFELEKAFPQEINYPLIQAQDNKGNTLPFIMDLWLSGKKNGLVILQEFKNYLINQKTLKPIVKKLFFMIAQLIFNPQLFAKGQIPTRGAIPLLRKLKQDGYALFILSNWDKASFEIIYSQYHDLFDYFDGIIISSKVNINKPDEKIYQAILTQYNLNPAETLFIDDQQINLDAAKKLRIKTILCPQKGILFKRPFLQNIRNMIKAE